MPELPSGTVTFLLTDIQASTALWEQHPEAAHAALLRHDALVETMITRYAGGLVRPRGEGDSRFAVFTRASDAVGAAAALQLALHTEVWPTRTPLRVRIALHTGEADLRTGDYYGQAVNRCARLRAVAHDGQTLLSAVTHDLVRSNPPQQLSFRDLGEHRLKDLVHTEHIYQLLAPDLPDAFPPLLTIEELSLNAPGAHRIRGYELREQIGAGSYGLVYRAYQTVVGRDVAIKVILPQFASQADFIRHFEQEAQLVAHLEHPHIVPLYDYWRDPTGAYLVMRWMRSSLADRLGSGPLAPSATLQVLEQIIPALALAHRQGVVHRDLKPANILLDADGSAYLADFGIARVLQDSALDEQPAGAARGAPAYSSPEQLLDEPITPRADIYSLGVLVYELLTGAHPFALATTGDLRHHQLYDPLPAVSARRPDLPTAIDDVIALATAKEPDQRYSDVVGLLVDLRRALDGSAATGWRPAAPSASQARVLPILAPVANPYKGLRAFQAADAHDFFGREALTSTLLGRLSERTPSARFLAVVGPSGSGKSSVVRAGVIPALRRGALPGSKQWFVIEMLPGSHPLEELEAALLRVAVNPPASLLEQLQEDERGLVRGINRTLPPDSAAELVLVIDQFEELFTLVENEAERVHLLNSLVAALNDARSRLRVIATLRADFYDRPLLYPTIGTLLQQRTEVVLPLTPAEVEEAIVGPATRAGLILESGLVTAIVADVAQQPGALPLLQYALTELFEQRDDRTLTLQTYRASGGVAGALARRADDLFNDLDWAGQEAARQLFLQLVTLGEGEEDTRCRVRRTELAGAEHAMDNVINLYGRYRLLTFDRDPGTRDPTVEVAHEALIRNWSRLQAWLHTNRDQLRVQRRLLMAATEWIKSRQDTSFLATGERLHQFADLKDGGSISLNASEHTYLEASLAEQRRQAALERDRQMRETLLQRRATNRLRALVGGLALFLIMALGLAAFAFRQQAQAVANLAQFEAQRLAAEALRLEQTHGGADIIALLSIRSIQMQYSPQGDAALAGAAMLDYPQQLFIGHTEPVNTVVFSPDSRYILTGSQDNTARLWDVQTGQVVHTFRGNTSAVQGVAFSPDGLYVLSGSYDATARLWDTRTGAVIRTFTGHIGPVHRVAFSPDGRYVLTGGHDTTARLWNVQTGQEVRRFTGHRAPVVGVAFSLDGRVVLTGSEDTTARTWDAQSGQELHRFIGHAERLTSVAFSADSAYVLTGSADESARLWNARTGALVHAFAEHTFVQGVAFSPDGKQIVTGSQDKIARLWDRETGQELRVLTGHTNYIWDVAYAPDGKSIVTASFDRTVRLWKIGGQSRLPQFSGHADVVNSVTYSPDGHLVLTSSTDKTARLWDASSGQIIRSFTGHSSGVAGIAFSPDGKQVLTGSYDATARLWDTQTGTLIRTFSGHTAALYNVAFAPDGRSILTSSADGTARLWNVQTGVLLRTFTIPATQVFDVAFSPDGRQMLTASFDKLARLWDVQSGTEIRRFVGHTDGVFGATFSPDGRQVLTSSYDRTARLWDTQTGREIRRFIGHTQGVMGLAFSPDGHYVLTASQDTTARLWNVNTGREIRRFVGHVAGVINVAFSPDGKYILTSSLDKTARQWQVDYHEIIADLCGRLRRDLSDEERRQYGIADAMPTCPPRVQP